MENIKHIFFDLDHTLLDFDKNSELSFNQIFTELKLNIKIQKFTEVYNPINLKYWKLYREEQITKEKLRYNRLKETFDALNYQISDSLIHQIGSLYFQYLPNYNFLIEGTTELLEYLHPKYKLHIITNGVKELQHKKIQTAKINTYFDVIVTSDSLGLKKPNPKVFNFAMEKAKANSNDSVMIGDSLEADIIGAENVGMKPIFFRNFTDVINNKFITVDRLLELKQYF